MKHIKTVVEHSTSKFAWNVLNTRLGGKRKIAVVPYVGVSVDDPNDPNRKEAQEHAEFISKALNKKCKPKKIQ